MNQNLKIFLVIALIVIIFYFLSKNKKSSGTIIATGTPQPLSDSTLPVTTVVQSGSVVITPENAQDVRTAAIEVANSLPSGSDKNDAIAIANQATAVINDGIAVLNAQTAADNAAQAAYIPPTSTTRFYPSGYPMFDSKGNPIPDGYDPTKDPNYVGIQSTPAYQQQAINQVVLPQPTVDEYGNLLINGVAYSSDGLHQIDPVTGDYL